MKEFEEENGFHRLAGPIRARDVATIQVNVGRLCDQACTHCHVDASPGRTEMMDPETMRDVLAALDRSDATRVEITGGAPELNPAIRGFVGELGRRDVAIHLRSNLTALMEPSAEGLAEILREHGVGLMASLPGPDDAGVLSQRGEGIFDRSISVLQILNSLGYGMPGGPDLEIVHNPEGPVLPGDQCELEACYRGALGANHGIHFTRLLALTNMPIGRFRSALVATDGLADYLNTLRCAFNPGVLDHLMCRGNLSVDWDGTLYDCDFNLALGLLPRVASPHIRDFDPRDLRGRIVATGEHCLGCAAGAGSSCGGALEVPGS